MHIGKYEPFHGPVLSRIIKESDGLNVIIKPAYNKNSYFYEIKAISDILLNHRSFKKIAKSSFNKIENNIKLLSRWYSY